MREVIEEFLSEYRNQDYFLGAILTGSCVTGNNTASSDIDIYIVTKDDTSWRERGNKKIGDYLIEYFINPKRKIISYFEEERKSLSLSTTNFFVNSEILYDKDGSVQELIDMAKKSRDTVEMVDVDEFKYKSNCYSVWDGFDELQDKYNSNEDIDFSYYLFLQRIIGSYFYNKKIPTLPLNKIEKILMNEEYFKRYNIVKMPDRDFCALLVSCFKEKERDKRFDNAKKLYAYFLSQFSDFDIGNYSLRSEAK